VEFKSQRIKGESGLAITRIVDKNGFIAVSPVFSSKVFWVVNPYNAKITSIASPIFGRSSSCDGDNLIGVFIYLL